MKAQAAPDIRTERLHLRPLADGDVDTLYPILTDRAVRRFLFDGDTVSRAFLGEAIAASQRHFSDHGWGLYGIAATDDDVLIGLCGFHNVGTPPERQLVYALAQPAWGRGYATEAVGAVIARARRLPALLPIVAAADAPNAASIALLRRLGFEPEVQLVERGRDVIRFILRR